MKFIPIYLFILITSNSLADGVNQSSVGDKSPVINTKGNVNITYTDDGTKKSIYNILTSLDKVERLLPMDINLQECLEEKRESFLKIKEIPKRLHTESSNYSRCLLHMKQEFKSPEWMIRQHSPLLVELSEKNPEIITIVQEVVFQIREMQNNQHQHEIWLTLGCPNDIKYVKNLDMNKYEGTCLFFIEDFDKYKERIEKRTSGEINQIPVDILAQMGSTELKDIDYKVAVVPEDQEIDKNAKVTGRETMIEQTVNFNEEVFFDMKKNIEKLREILLSFVKK